MKTDSISGILLKEPGEARNNYLKAFLQVDSTAGFPDPENLQDIDWYFTFTPAIPLTEDRFSREEEEIAENSPLSFSSDKPLKECFEYYGMTFQLFNLDTDIALFQKVLDANTHTEPEILYSYLVETFHNNHFREYIQSSADKERSFPLVKIPENAPNKKKLKRLLAISRKLFRQMQKEPQAKMPINLANALIRNGEKKEKDLEKATEMHRNIKQRYKQILSEVMLSEELNIYEKRVIQALTAILSDRNYSGMMNYVGLEEASLGEKIEVMTLKTSYKEIFECAGATKDDLGRFSGAEAKRLKERLHGLSGQMVPIIIQKGEYRMLYRQPLFLIYGDSIDLEGNSTLSLQIFPSMYEGADNNFIQFGKHELQELKELAATKNKNIEPLYDICLFFKSYDNPFMRISEEKLAERAGMKKAYEASKKKRVRKNLRELLELCKKGEYIHSYKKVKDNYEIRLNPKKCKRINFKRALSEGKKKGE